jgi:uncharacterized membrane protein YjjB (DUF3815 family)
VRSHGGTRRGRNTATRENWGVRLQITSSGRVDWPAPVLVLAGAVAFYACRLGVPRLALLAGVALGAIAVLLTRGLTPVSAELSRSARTLMAALLIGIVGTLLAHRSRAPAALWTVPAILPLLPAPSTLLPLLTETEAARQALQGQAVSTAFSIGVGDASGSIAVDTWLRYRERILQPAAGALSERLSARVLPPGRGRGGPWRRRGEPAAPRQAAPGGGGHDR